jgi:hypothetical protein
MEDKGTRKAKETTRDSRSGRTGSKSHAMESAPPRRRSWLLLFVVALLVTAAGLLANEFAWRSRYPLVQPAAAAPDGAFVAELRSMPDSPLLAPQSSGVFVRTRWGVLGSVGAELVFVGACDSVDTRWMSRRRLLIECELRSGEPRLLQALVRDVVIELVVQPKFARAPQPARPDERLTRW